MPMPSDELVVSRTEETLAAGFKAFRYSEKSFSKVTAIQVMDALKDSVNGYSHANNSAEDADEFGSDMATLKKMTF